MFKRKRKLFTIGLTAFMIVSMLYTNVVHATGDEAIPFELAEETIVVGDVSENSCESDGVGEVHIIEESGENIILEAEEAIEEYLAEEVIVEADSVEEEPLAMQNEENLLEAESLWITENFQIQHKVVNYWDNEYQGEIIITNLGEATIEDWNLMFEMNIDISQIWNATIDSCKDNTYIIVNNNWNANINASQSISFGYIATYENMVVFPESYVISGAEDELKVDDYEITYEIVDMWEDGYVANLTINNISEIELRNWKISFDLQDSIYDLWNGKINANENGRYVIHCADYNSIIKAGESVTIGFRVQGEELQMYPENYAVKVIVHSSMRADMQDDVIGIAYFEELKEEDYRIESDGIQYVANQLNLVGKEGVTFEQISKLGEEYEFEIVGYIELTNDYQVKFVLDKTYEELNQLVKELAENDLILEAELNLISLVGECSENYTYQPNDELW